jgi:putative glutamine amidotransferase
MSKRPLIGITAFETKYIHPPHSPLYATGQRYVRAIEDAGGLPVIMSPALSNDTLGSIFARLDGLLLSGGGDIDPSIYGEEAHSTIWGLDMNRDRAELAMARWAADTRKPILCICRGIQVLNVALGGSLVQDIASMVPDALTHMFDEKDTPREKTTHPVHVAPDSLLSQLLQADEAAVNSWHHQSLKRVANDLKVVAKAPDGIVEAVELAGHRFALGVQWHPEWLYQQQPEMARLFTGLIDAATVNMQRIHE